MAQAVATNEVDDQEHEQPAQHHYGNSDLQAELHVVKIGNSANNLRTEPAHKLSDKHIQTYRRGMGALGHHVVDHRGDWPVIPGHEECRDGETSEHGRLFFGLDGRKDEGSGKKETGGYCDKASMSESPLKTVRDKTPEEHADQTTHDAD